MNLAPVMDVDTNPDNPVIANRSFSSNPDKVAELGQQFNTSLQAEGVAACAKHFLGHGDTILDSHGLGFIEVGIQAAVYFNKIQCFCFEEQRLLPGEKIDMPVFFYVDPEFASDPRMDDITNLVLSYTFFRVEDTK